MSGCRITGSTGPKISEMQSLHRFPTFDDAPTTLFCKFNHAKNCCFPSFLTGLHHFNKIINNKTKNLTLNKLAYCKILLRNLNRLLKRSINCASVLRLNHRDLIENSFEFAMYRCLEPFPLMHSASRLISWRCLSHTQGAK